MERNDSMPLNKKDPMFEKAVGIVLKQNTYSTATLQRELGIGYARADRIVEQMQVAGILSNFASNKSTMERKDSTQLNQKDPIFNEAVGLVSKQKNCSPATLQTRLAVGYIRARRILEQMEAEGIVGHEDAKGKRKVLMKNIKLTWNGGGCCPGQWYAYFYNEQDNRTYCVYIREDSFWWSASLRSAEGRYSGNEFEDLTVESCLWEGIDLAFDYLADGKDWHFSKIVEEAIVYLNHRFPYFRFDSEQREKYDFMDGVTEENRKSRLDVLERREELMRNYLAKYEGFKENLEL